MIDVKNVSMKFNLGIEKEFSMKQAFINCFSGKKTKKKKDTFLALKDVSFHIDKGEVVGLIGSNGAGKSTLLKVVSGVMKPTKGEVKVNGNISPMIELGAGFDGELTAKENIYLNGAILGYSEEFINEKFDEIVEFSELRDFLNVPVKNFSSGMTAKLAFSIATVVNPEILIVDEILSVGDIKFQEKSRNKMMELISGGTTVLYVSHSIDSIKEICTKVIWLEHGEVQKIGDPKEICAEYYYHMLFDDEKNEKTIEVKDIKIDKNIITYDYKISDNLNPFFNMGNKLKLEYSTDVSKVPYEISVIPFITGILPMIFLENIKVYVDKIDKDFYESIENIRNAYKKMLPKGNWKGRIIANEIIDHSTNSKIGNSSVFYSGGVDSTLSIILHKKENPDYLLIWGSDILQNNEESWTTAKNLALSTAKTFGCNNIFISSNFRFYLNENALTTKYRRLLPTSWWYDVQHGAALLGHVAPLAYLNKYSVHYIPSTNSPKDKDEVIASNPLLDESMKFCGCKIIHDGFKYDRIDKIAEIVDYKKHHKDEKIILRVCCVERHDELNCCNCEKCWRTICEILACKGDPNDFGFEVTKNELKQLKKFIDTNQVQESNIKYWKEIKELVEQDKDYFSKTELSWLIGFDLKEFKIKDFSHEVWDENGVKIETKSGEQTDEKKAN